MKYGLKWTKPKANYIDLTGSSDEDPVVATNESDSDSGFEDHLGKHRRGPFQEGYRGKNSVPVSPTDDEWDDLGPRYPNQEYPAPWGVSINQLSDEDFDFQKAEGVESESESETEGEEIPHPRSQAVSNLPTMLHEKGGSTSQSPPQLSRRDSMVYYSRGGSPRRYTTHTHWNRVQTDQGYIPTTSTGPISGQSQSSGRETRELPIDEEHEGISGIPHKRRKLHPQGDQHTGSLRQEEINLGDRSRGNYEGCQCQRDYDKIPEGVLSAFQKYTPTCGGCRLIEFMLKDFLTNCQHQNQNHLDHLAGCYIRGMAQLKSFNQEATTTTTTTTPVSVGSTSNREVNNDRVPEKTPKGV